MQVAVGVKQQRLKTVDEAVRATLELESYMKPAAKGVAPVGLEEESGFSAVSAVQKTQEAMMGVLQNLVQRMEKLEAEGSNRSRRWPRNRGGGGGGGRTREEMVSRKRPPIQGMSKAEPGKRQPPSSQSQVTGGKGGLAHKEISIFPVNAATAFRVTGSVGGISVTFLLDTGSAVTLVRRDLWDQIGSGATLRPCEHRLVGVDGSPLKIHGSAHPIGGVDFVTTVIVGDSLTTEAILGLDFLQEHRCTVDIGSKQLRVSGHKLVIPLQQSAASPCIGRVGVEMADSVQLPAYSELEVMARAVTPIEGNTWLIEGMKTKRSPVQIARALVIPRSERVPVRMLNPTAEPVQVPKGMVVAEMELVEDPPEVVESEIGVMSVEQSGELSESFLKKIAEDSGTELSVEEKVLFYQFLLKYGHLFAQDSTDLGRTDKVQHSIYTGEARPVRQPVRRLPPQRREVRKLLEEMLKKDSFKNLAVRGLHRLC